MSFKLLDKILNKNVKYYDHYISLGYNCEFAYRFFEKYKFVESSLFTWTNSINIINLINALKNLDIILAHDPKMAGIMWRCIDSDIRFHGTEPYDMHSNIEKYSEEDFIPYKQELIDRIHHLKEKFKLQISDSKYTLLTYNYSANDDTTVIIHNIKTLKKTLEQLGAKNFDLLVILEKSNYFNHEDKDNIYIRYVDSFAPENDVITKNYDKKSWENIFKEFKPNFKLSRKKRFKFEDV